MPSSFSLATRCRRTRDLHGAEPPKTITKCQGCHCAHVRGLRARVLRSRTLSSYSTSPRSLPPLVPFKPLPARPLSSFPTALAPAAAVPLSQQWHWGEITIPVAYFTMTLATHVAAHRSGRSDSHVARNLASSRVRPDALFAAAFVSEISPWRIRQSAFREGVPPLVVRFARLRASSAQGRRESSKWALRHTAVFTNKRSGRDAAAASIAWTRRVAAA